MQAPQTYHQWLECFQRLEKCPRDPEVLALIPQGSYGATPTDTFLVRISETVSTMLSESTRKFLRDLDRTLADGEPDMAVLLARRFRRQLSRCLIYREMKFLEDAFVRELDTGFEAQLQAFWADLLRQVNATARESMDPRMEDLAVELRRINILDRRSPTST